MKNDNKNGIPAEIKKFQKRKVSAKVLCDYCGLSLSTIERLENNECKRFTIEGGSKKRYKLAKWLLLMISGFYLTDDEINKFKEHSGERIKRYKFYKYKKYLINEEDAILKYDLKSSQIQEFIDNGLERIVKKGKSVFIAWEITEHVDYLNAAEKIKRQEYVR